MDLKSLDEGKIMKFIGQCRVNFLDHTNVLKSLDGHTTTKKNLQICVFLNKKIFKK